MNLHPVKQFQCVVKSFSVTIQRHLPLPGSLKKKPFEVRPSQYSSTRKPKRITFVLLIDEHQKVVPQCDLRRKMKDDERILKLAINRSMSSEEVKITSQDAYSSLGMSDVIYMAISHGNALVMHKNQEMDGNQVIELAGQGRICMLAHVSCIGFTVALITY